MNNLSTSHVTRLGNSLSQVLQRLKNRLPTPCGVDAARAFWREVLGRFGLGDRRALMAGAFLSWAMPPKHCFALTSENLFREEQSGVCFEACARETRLLDFKTFRRRG